MLGARTAICRLGFLLLMLVLPVASPESLPVVNAGEFNEVLSIGDAAPAWENLPGTDGQQHSLADLKETPVVVVVFTCASCPTAVDYEERIEAFSKSHSDKVAVVAICVNQVDEDKLPALTQRVKEKNFSFTYLSDDSQKIARDYGAVFTPEFYVLNPDRQIVYMGAMDDSTNPEMVTTNYLQLAVQAALKNELPVVKEVIARGCRVRYAKERRRNRPAPQSPAP